MDRDTYPGEVVDDYFIMNGNFIDADDYEKMIPKGFYARAYPLKDIQKCTSAFDLSEYGFYKSCNDENVWINNHAESIVKAFNPPNRE